MIPKIIYMCHKNLDKIKIHSQKWKKLNPEYKIKLYDDDKCRKFLLEKYSKLHLEIFDFIPDGPIKADFWRVCIINKYGGLYVDADINPIEPLNKYVSKNDYFVTCISYHFNPNKLEFQLNPHFILSNKNNKILSKCIETYIKMYKTKIKYNYWTWSICKIMVIKGIRYKTDQILIIDGKKYKFILEGNDLNTCTYKDKIVFYNRYDFYREHNFIK